MYCPNPGCPFVARMGYPAEYRPGFQTCSDCGATLTQSQGQVNRVVDVGPEIEPPLQLPRAEAGASTWSVLMIGGLVLSMVGVSKIPASGVLGGALLVGGVALALFAWKSRKPLPDAILERRKLGITWRLGTETWSIAWSELESVVLTEFSATAEDRIKLSRYRLVFTIQGGRSFAIETIKSGSTLMEDPFVTWARALEKQF